MLLNLCTNDSKMIFKNNELLSYLKDNKNDVVVTLGAGNISDLVKPIISVLSR